MAASKAGIEDLWLQQRRAELGGREIAAAYLAGAELARRLYEGSALVTAHLVKGVAKVLGLVRDWEKTVVVGHGGAFQVPGYGDDKSTKRPVRSASSIANKIRAVIAASDAVVPTATEPPSDRQKFSTSAR